MFLKKRIEYFPCGDDSAQIRFSQVDDFENPNSRSRFHLVKKCGEAKHILFVCLNAKSVLMGLVYFSIHLLAPINNNKKNIKC